MTSNVDLNVDSYTTDELYQILGLDNTASSSEVTEASNNLYNRFLNENNYDMAYFFQDVQNSLLQDKQQDEESESEEDMQNIESTQIGNWWENEYIEQTADKGQEDKTTDRKQKVDIYNEGDHVVMKQNELGVNNDYSVPVAQGTMNPNLKNITQRIVSIDSKYRQNTVPYTNNPDGVSSSTNFTLDLSDPLTNTLTLKLYSIQIPYTWYLIDLNYSNNYFKIVVNGKEECITIDSGNYSSEELIQEINEKLVDKNYEWINFLYNQKTAKVQIQNTKSVESVDNNVNDLMDYNVEIVFYSSEFDCDNKNCSKNGKINSTLGWILGFRGQTDENGEVVYIYNIEVGDSITSESVVDTYGSKYFLLVVDDFNQNHLNKGLVSITNLDNTLSLPEYYNADLSFNSINCLRDKTTSVVVSEPRRITRAQMYSLNEIMSNRKNNQNLNQTAPTTTDVLAIIPIKKEGLLTGQQFVEYGSTLQLNLRTYFGPVDIDRLKVRLVDDKGFTVNLNGGDWSFSLISENLYQY